MNKLRSLLLGFPGIIKVCDGEVAKQKYSEIYCIVAMPMKKLSRQSDWRVRGFRDLYLKEMNYKV